MIDTIPSSTDLTLALVVGLAFGCGAETDSLFEPGLVDAGTEARATSDLGAEPNAEIAQDRGPEITLTTDRALDAAEQNRGQWTWIPVEGARCRDGSETGFLLRLNGNVRKLVVYFQGGGACFNESTCASNPSAFSAENAEQAGSRLNQAIFDDSSPDNPVADWNVAYFPYCTGDIFIGTQESVNVPGVGAQDFVGAHNVEIFTERLARRFALRTDRVLVTGSSAGGFGAAFSFPVIADRFPQAQTDLLDDSGPLFASGDALAPCLLELWLDLWGDAIVSVCPECSPTEDGIFGWSRYLTQTYPSSRFALASFTEDLVIRSFLGFGEDNCSSQNAMPISSDVYTNALINFRRDMPAWGTYYVDGAFHTFLLLTSTYETPFVDETSLLGFLGQFLDGDVGDLGP